MYRCSPHIVIIVVILKEVKVYRRRYENRRSSKPLTALKNKIWRKQLSIWRMKFLHPAMWHNHDIDFARWLYPAMWHDWNHDSEFTKCCNVIHGFEMTCRWIRPVAAPCNVTRSSGIMTLNSPSGITLQCGRWIWDDMPWNSQKRPPYWIQHLVSISTLSPQSTCHYAPVCEILSSAEKNDVMSIFKMTNLSHLGF